MTRFAPLWQQSNDYPAALDRALIGALWPLGGVSGAAPTAVVGSMDVTIPPGSAAVPLAPGQGSALCRWDAAETVTLAAAPPSGQSRIDLVVCLVRDPDLDGGGSADFVFSVVAGTPAALGAETKPADGELEDGELEGVEPFAGVAPAVPANALVMTQVTVPGGAANLNTATLTRRWAPLVGPQTFAARAYASDFVLPEWNASALIPYHLIDFDPWGCWSGNFYKAPVDGLYLATSKFEAQPTTDGLWSHNYLVGGSVRTQRVTIRQGKGAGWTQSSLLSDIVKMDAGETIGVYAGVSTAPWVNGPNQRSTNWFLVALQHRL